MQKNLRASLSLMSRETVQELTDSGELNKSYNCTIWNEALIQNSAENDQKLVLQLVPNCVVV